MSVYSDKSISDPRDAHYNDPWCRFMREMRVAFEGIPTARPPAGMFPGRNFMADEIVSYHHAADGGWVEVSYGRFLEDYVIGLTFRRVGEEFGDVETFTNDPQGASERLREVLSA
jgi:hypothetical protein